MSTTNIGAISNNPIAQNLGFVVPGVATSGAFDPVSCFEQNVTGHRKKGSVVVSEARRGMHFKLQFLLCFPFREVLDDGN